MIVRRTTALSVLMLAALAGTLVNGLPAEATPPVTKAPVAVGRGGAASTVDIDATRVAIDVLRHGGNAVDAAVAAAATLGVTEPFSSGLGGGGFLVFYNARTKTVHTIDGREAAPASMKVDAFINPATGAAVRVPGGARQRHLGRACRGRRRPGRPRCGSGARSPCATRCARRSRSPTGASWSTRRSSTRSTRTSRRSRSSARPARCTCRAGRRPRSARPSAIRISPGPTGCSAGRAWARSTGASWPPTSYARCSTRRSSRRRRYRGRSRSAPASWKPPTWPATTSVRRGRPTCVTAASTCSGCRPRPAADRRLAKGSTSWRTGISATCRRPRRCTGTSKRARSPSPTATATSATTPRARCSTNCSTRGSPASGRA